MKQTRAVLLLITALLCSNLLNQAQQSSSTNASTVVPTLVKFSGSLTDINGKPLNGVVGVTFLLYKDEQGGAPLWMETQNVTPDNNGHYTAVLGSTTSQGLPTDLFASGEARWLGVQAQGQAEQSRVLLVSVPYALKAGDAQTVGGLPASAFVLAAPAVGTIAGNATASAAAAASSGSAPPPASSDVTTTGGTVNAIPLFTTATNVQNSILTQAGTTTVNVVGKLNLPATGAATAAKGFNSRPESMVASVFNSGTSSAVPQVFQLQAEPVGNDTSTASGTLNLLYGSGTAAPAETGLKINNKGLITFATGQVFPGTGNGTVTNIASGAGLTGGPITGSGTLSIANAGVTNTMLAHPSLTVAAGTGLTGGGAVALGGTTTLNLDTTKVPQLSGNNSFKGNESVSGNVTATSFSGSGASLTNVNATELGGLAASGYAQLNALNRFSLALFAPQLTSTGSAEVDNGGTNSGNYVPGLQFGPTNSGETIASAQASGSANYQGLDFYTAATPRMSITNNGEIGIGTVPGPDDFVGFLVNAPGIGYSDGGGYENGIQGIGFGQGTGVSGFGGEGLPTGDDGVGGIFQGGTSTQYGDGVDVYSGSSGVAGSFTGNVEVTGNVSKAGGSFKIDHPLDPANKYLYHSFVESPDMMNIYNGNTTLDENGEATIQMPEWFSALNRDFRYQLTCIGGFAPVYVAEELANNQFKIGGGHAGMKVSWQITGVRQDAWANAHRIPVEEEKNARERGFYLHPELYGQPKEKQIEWARHPQAMKRLQDHQRKTIEKQTRATASAR